ncbi:hypothetical protein GJA_3423 [Janthinobacterium agaricidamnosum NBRC 102515 = DSM 9628]|uniref:Uncharacterized protein n=1 Tax=Janthinobacterium agaricidamnosum NBRC 102515 = DSM 9628 TaxID=1349767 RepID=W0V831_9BURK|nr:hypothetical protein GJA_3423 [Janthinobacterium agaricidamnosum NBRC 102515 = DSM 9628]
MEAIIADAAECSGPANNPSLKIIIGNWFFIENHLTIHSAFYHVTQTLYFSRMTHGSNLRHGYVVGISLRTQRMDVL